MNPYDLNINPSPHPVNPSVSPLAILPTPGFYSLLKYGKRFAGVSPCGWDPALGTTVLIKLGVGKL